MSDDSDEFDPDVDGDFEGPNPYDEPPEGGKPKMNELILEENEVIAAIAAYVFEKYNIKKFDGDIEMLSVIHTEGWESIPRFVVEFNTKEKAKKEAGK